MPKLNIPEPGQPMLFLEKMQDTLCINDRVYVSTAKYAEHLGVA